MKAAETAMTKKVVVTEDELAEIFGGEQPDPADTTEDELEGVPAEDPTPPTPTDFFVANYLKIFNYMQATIGKQSIKDETRLTIMAQAAGAASVFTQIELAQEQNK